MDKTSKLIGVVGYLESECEECQIQLTSLRSKIAKVESELVGKRERLLQAKESLRRHRDSLPMREVTTREESIARMFGIGLNVGDKLSNETWSRICSHRTS
jgi:DNA-binding NarL/FixJ family response regulator